jgi:CHASE2 domain-containing sensor protein
MHVRDILQGIATTFAGREVLAWALHAVELDEVVAATIKAGWLAVALVYLCWFCRPQLRNLLGMVLGGAALLRVVCVIFTSMDIWNAYWLVLWAVPLVAWTCLTVQSYRWYRIEAVRMAGTVV